MSELRQRILEASVALVAEKGVRAVSFREVARRAGVSHQAPYHHFGNHQGILLAIAKEGFGGLTAAMQAAADEAPGPLEALVAGGLAYVRFARDHVGHHRVMFDNALVQLDREGDPIEEAAQTFATLQRLAGDAHAAGYGAGAMSADALAHLCWSTVHGLATLVVEGVLAAKHPPRGPEVDVLIDEVIGGLARSLTAARSPGVEG